jgi:endo-1,4-beta-xylanase
LVKNTVASVGAVKHVSPFMIFNKNKSLKIEMMMKLQSLLFVALTFLVACNSGKKSPETKGGSIKDAYEGKFLIGVALNTSQVDGSDTLALPLIENHFNSVVAENCMKSEKIQPKQGEFTFDDADKFIAFAEARNMFVIGHCLVGTPGSRMVLC